MRKVRATTGFHMTGGRISSLKLIELMDVSKFILSVMILFLVSCAGRRNSLNSYLNMGDLERFLSDLKIESLCQDGPGVVESEIVDHWQSSNSDKIIRGWSVSYSDATPADLQRRIGQLEKRKNEELLELFGKDQVRIQFGCNENRASSSMNTGTLRFDFQLAISKR